MTHLQYLLIIINAIFSRDNDRIAALTALKRTYPKIRDVLSAAAVKVVDINQNNTSTYHKLYRSLLKQRLPAFPSAQRETSARRRVPTHVKSAVALDRLTERPSPPTPSLPRRICGCLPQETSGQVCTSLTHLPIQRQDLR